MAQEFLVTKDLNSFVLASTFPNSIAVISTFKKIGNEYKTDFKIDKNKLYRVKKMNEVLHPSEIYIGTNDITFECVKLIDENTDIFKNLKNVESGVIHFDIIINKVEKRNIELDVIEEINICNINPRIIIKNWEKPQIIELDNITYPEFKTDKIKVFSSIFIKGYGLCIITPTYSTFQFTVFSPKDNNIGTILNKNINMLYNIQKVWPIFNIEKKNKISNIFLKDKLIELMEDIKHPRLIQFHRDLKSTNTTISILGNSQYIF